MGTLQELLCLSKEFCDKIGRPFPTNERDQLISKINEFLSKREDLMKNLAGPFSTEDKLLGQQIIDYDRKIETRFNGIQQKIQKDFLNVKNQKKNTSKYINPYESTFTNGVFMDKRK